MDIEHNNDPLKNIMRSMIEDLNKISFAASLYSKEFPNESNIIFSTDGQDDKKLATAYYKFISVIANSASNMETSLSDIPKIMTAADRNIQFERIALCDQLLSIYGEFKQSIACFAQSNERLITENKISAAVMLRYLSEFGYKLNYFNEFLKEHTL